MLSVGSLTSFGGVSLQFARALAPFVCNALRSAVAGRGLLTSASASHAQPQVAEPEPDFNSEALPQLDPAASEMSQFRPPVAFPEAVWSKLIDLVPTRPRRQPVAVDISVGCASRAGLELAERGFNVLSVACQSNILQRTLIYGEPNHPEIDVIAAQLEPSVVQDNAADLVTCMHGLHLLDTRHTLLEAHRILRPGGKLVVAWTDRDLLSHFVDQLEEALEIHTHGAQAPYARASAQHSPAAWGPMLRQGGLFRLVGYSAHDAPLLLQGGAGAVADAVGSQSGVVDLLMGAARLDLEEDLKSLAEYHFGQGPVVLPMQTRMFVLEKVTPPSLM